MTSIIGAISLNISFCLYFIFYVPQIIHNQKLEHIQKLSLFFHLLLFASYFFDLIYGFSGRLPWQYKIVSIVGLMLLSIQHIQCMLYAYKKNNTMRYLILGMVLLFPFMIIYFIGNQKLMYSAICTSVTGSIARICGILYCFPQLIKNKILKSTESISYQFVYLNLILSLLDTISAWCLDWGWPNKLASPVNAMLMVLFLYQRRRYIPVIIQNASFCTT